jgi:hypothetical protein
MGYAVEMYFDEQSNRQIREIWAAIDSSLPGLNASPHLSLSLHGNVEPACMSHILQVFASQNRRISVEMPLYSSFLTDEGVLFLAPVVTEPLLALHKAFHHLLAEYGIESHPYHRPGAWIPHCTMDINLRSADLLRKFALCREMGPVHGVMIETVGLISYPPVMDLFRYPLERG